jgi:branched-chain amino acid transport system substrate-binding protein
MLLVLLLSLLFILGGSLPALTAEPLRIGLSLGLTGKFALPAAYQKNGYLLWEKGVNKRGGVAGRQVSLIIRDDESDPEKAQQIYRDLILQDRVDFVFAPFSSQITAAVMPFLEEQRYPILSAGASASSLWEQGYRYIFSLFTPASEMPANFLEMIVRQDLERIAVLHEDDLFSKTLAQGSRKWAKRFGLDILLDEDVSGADGQLQKLLLQARDAGVQVLIYCGYTKGADSVRFHLARMGWYPSAFYAPVGPGMTGFKAELKELAEKVFSTSQWEFHGEFSPPGTREFIDAYEKDYAESPSYFAVTAFSAGQILESAIMSAGVLDRDKVRMALSSHDATSLIGYYKVDRTGRQVKNFTLVNQIQNGKQVVVWPTNLSNSQPIF